MDIRIAGLVLISPALSDETFFDTPDNFIPNMTYFPSFATTAWYHGTVGTKYKMSTVGQVFDAAKQFAETRLLSDLLQGADLDPTERDAAAQEIADFTGLSKDLVLSLNLRVSDGDMFTSALDSGKTWMGRYDSRFTQPAAGSYDDPSSTIPGYAFAAGINEYLREDLQFTDPIPYNVMGNVSPWTPDAIGRDVMPAMASALAALSQRISAC